MKPVSGTKTGIAIFAAALLSCALLGGGQDVFRADVELVQLDAQVAIKKTARPVGDLKKEDFELYEDGVPQQIAQLSRGQLPLSLVLLFDLTESVGPVLKPLAAGAIDALQHLKPEDEVAVMTYSATAEVLQDFTTDRLKVLAAIQKASEMKSSDRAYFNEAVFQASAHLKPTDPKRRRAIIWLTDNVPDTPAASVHSEDDAFRSLFETGTVVSSLLERSSISNFMSVFLMNPVSASSRAQRPPGNVYKYAERSGGDVMKSSKEDVSTKLASLLEEIRTQYTLGYYPSTAQPKGSFCRIKLQVKQSIEKSEGPLLVRTKEGYYG